MEIRKCTSCGTIAADGGAIRCAKCEGRLELGDERELLGRRFGSYTLVEVLGAGGMGVVFRAAHETLGRDAAVKLLLPGESDDKARRRFVNEARLLAGLRHPNVVAVYDFAETEWGAPYLVLERLIGRSAESLLDEARARGEGGLPRAVVSAILADAVAGLSAAHAAGIVHRDLKPSNLFVAIEDGRAITKVIDFGIARADAGDPEATRLTASAAVVGTPLYLAPEQLRGDPLGPACDQYALALTACELLSGVPVRDGMTFARILRFEIAQPVPIRERFPQLAGATARALERATEPEPERRHRDLAALLDAMALPAPERGAEQLLSLASGPVAEGEARPAVGGSETVRLDPTRRVHDERRAPASRRLGRGGARLGRGARIALASLCVLAGAAALGVALRAGRILPQAGTASAAPPPSRRLEPILPAPGDGRRILGEGDASWVVGSVGAWTLVGEKDGASTRVSWPGSAVVLGAAASGELWLRRSGRLVAIDPASGRERDVGGVWPEPWASAAPERLTVSPRGGFVALDRDDAIAVAALGERGLEPRFEVRIGANTTGRRGLVLGDERLVVAESEGSLSLHRLADGAESWRRPLPEHHVRALAYVDGLPWLAVGSSVGEVRIVAVADGREVARVPRAGQVASLLWIPDRPTLAIGGERGLALWRPEGAGGSLEEVPGIGGCVDLRLGRTSLGCLDRVGTRLERIALGSAPVRAREGVGRVEAWAAIAAETGPAAGSIFVGSADGALARFDLATGERVEKRVHDAGVTALAIAGDRLASASDDRTVAVWKLPALELEYRSRAHDYLINALDLEDGELWSASSDRRVKRWSWPSLEEIESVDVDRASGVPAELHALDVERGGERIWLGTWSRFALRLDRDGDRFRARRTPVVARAGYRWVALPALEARVLLGLEPPELVLFDERRDDVTRLPTYDRPLFALAPAGEHGFWAAGGATVLRFELERGSDGALDWAVRSLFASDLGVTGAAAAHGGTLALADNRGDLRLLDVAALEALPPLTRRSDLAPR